MIEDMTAILDWAREQFASDAWMPGVTVSKLSAHRWYVSLTRWPEPEKRVVVRKARALSPEVAMSRLREKLLTGEPVVVNVSTESQ